MIHPNLKVAEKSVRFVLVSVYVLFLASGCHWMPPAASRVSHAIKIPLDDPLIQPSVLQWAVAIEGDESQLQPLTIDDAIEQSLRNCKSLQGSAYQLTVEQISQSTSNVGVRSQTPVNWLVPLPSRMSLLDRSEATKSLNERIRETAVAYIGLDFAWARLRSCKEELQLLEQQGQLLATQLGEGETTKKAIFENQQRQQGLRQQVAKAWSNDQGLQGILQQHLQLCYLMGAAPSERVCLAPSQAYFVGDIIIEPAANIQWALTSSPDILCELAVEYELRQKLQAARDRKFCGIPKRSARASESLEVRWRTARAKVSNVEHQLASKLQAKKFQYVLLGTQLVQVSNYLTEVRDYAHHVAEQVDRGQATKLQALDAEIQLVVATRDERFLEHERELVLIEYLHDAALLLPHLGIAFELPHPADPQWDCHFVGAMTDHQPGLIEESDSLTEPVRPPQLPLEDTLTTEPNADSFNPGLRLNQASEQSVSAGQLLERSLLDN
ncbi:MAG: hypothetical protein WBD31_13620 [Rubripirellula sp.]